MCGLQAPLLPGHIQQVQECQICSGTITSLPVHNGDVYKVNILNPNGCMEEMEFIVSTLVPTTKNRNVSIYCGDSLNLDTLDQCGNNGQPWRNNTTSSWIPNGRVALTSSTSFTCVIPTLYMVLPLAFSCVININVTVLPRPTKC